MKLSVKLYLFSNISNRYVVQITPAFKCSGVWPRSAAHWPLPHVPWPHPNLVAEVKTEGFDLLSKECLSLQVNTEDFCLVYMETGLVKYFGLLP